MITEINTTNPSRESFGTRFPKVEKFRASFSYNFFQPMEAMEETGVKRAMKSHNRNERDNDSRSFKKSLPRHVTLSWDKVQVGEYSKFDQEARTGLIVSNNNDKIQHESHITIAGNSVQRFQNKDIRYKIMTQALRIAALQNLNLSLSSEISQTDIIDSIVKLVGNSKDQEIFSRLVEEELFYRKDIANQVNRESPNLPFDSGQNFKTSFHINEKFAADIFGNNINKLTRGIKSLSVLDGAQDPNLTQIQQSARANPPKVDMLMDYNPELIPWKIESIQGGNINMPVMGTVGYVITKSKMINGQKTRVDTFYIDGTNVQEFVDGSVSYGQTYIYEISTITNVEMSIDNNWMVDDPHIANVSVLIQSDPTQDVHVLCAEDEAPPPPDTIFYKYNYDNNSLILDWRIPITSQRDIKGFQILRRESILSPFILQKQYDFNDLVGASPFWGKGIFPSNEAPLPSLVQLSEYSTTSYEDHEFDRNSSYIYTVCSVDAHGYVSDYGTQTLVSFDKNKNKITLKAISQPGAPRAYPNMFVNPTGAANINAVRITEDVMRDSKHKKMRVYFNPDSYFLRKEPAGDLSHLKTRKTSGSGPAYKFEILNVDRQKSKTLTIGLVNPGQPPGRWNSNFGNNDHGEVNLKAFR